MRRDQPKTLRALANAWWANLRRAWDEDLPLACILGLWLLLVVAMWLPVGLGVLAKRIWRWWERVLGMLTAWNPNKKPWER